MQGISDDYWNERGQPSHCVATPVVQFMTLAELDELRGDEIAIADGENCVMRFGIEAISGRSDFCWLYLHEDGHAERNLPHTLNWWSVMNQDGIMPKICLTKFVPAQVRFMRRHGWKCVPRPSFAAFNCHNNKNTYKQVDAI